MVSTKKYSLQTIYRLASIFLKVNGIFLDGKNKCIPTINAILGLFFSGTFLLFCVIGVIVYWEDIESIYRAEGVPLSIKVFVCLILVLYQKNEWERLVKHVAALNLYERLEEEERRDMDATINFYIKFAIVYSVQTIASVILFYLKAMFFFKMPLELYTPCDVKVLECYVPYLIYEVFMDVFMIPFPLGLNLLYVYIVLAIICQIEAIKCDLRRIDVHTKMEDLRVIIDYHNEVSSIIDEFRSTCKNLFFVIYLASMLSVCVVFYMINRNGFPPNMDDVTRYLPFVLIFIMEFYIYAFGASNLLSSIDSIADEVYESNWPEIPDLEVRRSLILMIQKSQTTKGLTIGGLLILDLQVFIKVMQNAFSFYTLMANLGNEEK